MLREGVIELAIAEAVRELVEDKIELLEKDVETVAVPVVLLTFPGFFTWSTS